MHQYLLTEFEQLGYKPNSLFLLPKLKLALDTIIKRNSSGAYTVFDQEIACEVWNQCQKTVSGEVTLIHYIRVLYEAKEIIQSRVKSLNNFLTEKDREINSNQRYSTIIKDAYDINKIRDLEGRLTSLRKEIKEVKEVHAESLEDLKILNFLFSKEGKDPRNGETEWKEKYIMNVSVPEENSSEIFIKRSDSTLKAALLLILFLLATEPFIMVVKSNFLSLLAGISLITIFILDCLNVAYVRFCLLLLLTNMLFDVLWFFCKGINYWNGEGLEYRLFRFYGGIAVLLVFLSVAAKILLVGILLSYVKTIEPSNIDVFGAHLNLTGENNLITTKINSMLI